MQVHNLECIPYVELLLQIFQIKSSITFRRSYVYTAAEFGGI